MVLRGTKQQASGGFAQYNKIKMATRTISNTGGNWNSSAAWVEGVVPVLGDAVGCTGTSGPLTISDTGRACTSLNLTGYPNTLTMTFGLSVAGSVTLGGTIVGTGNLLINGISTITSNGITWPGSFTSQISATTLADPMVVTGNVSIGNIVLNGSTLTCNANYSKTSGSGSGTTNIIIGGNSTIVAAGAVVNNPFTITSSGNVTISGTCNFGNSFTYNSGTMLGASTPIIGFTLNAPTMTLNALFTFPGRLNTTQSLTFAGAYGFTVDDFTCTTVGRTITFHAGNTYTMNSGVILTGSSGSKINIVSSTPSTAFYFVLASTASCNISFVNATDPDSGGGRIIHNRKGIHLRTVNWYITNPDFFSMF